MPAKSSSKTTARVSRTLTLPAGRLAYQASVGSLRVTGPEKSLKADIGYFAYEAEPKKGAVRPITFFFPGGPGESSAGLHLGGFGPQRLTLTSDGTLPPDPLGLSDNGASWLAFSDLVFVDPVGTGCSRARAKKAKGQEPPDSAFFALEPDLQALSAFVCAYLERFGKTKAPLVIAGASYGGLRAAALTALLPKACGVPVRAAVLISPVLEYAFLEGGRGYNLLPWVITLPTMAATATAHDRIDLKPWGGEADAMLAAAEKFARAGLLAGLAKAGDPASAANAKLYSRLAGFTGLPADWIQARRGRVKVAGFAEELLRSANLRIGLLDGTQTGAERAGDPSMARLEALVAAVGPVIKAYMRELSGHAENGDYLVQNLQALETWAFLPVSPAVQGYAGAWDDLAGSLRSGALKVFVGHGRQDLRAPYLASRYLADQAGLAAPQRNNIQVQTYLGGHLFYLRDGSRREFATDVGRFYAAAGL